MRPYIRLGEVSIADASVIEANRCRPNNNRHGGCTQDKVFYTLPAKGKRELRNL